ncbi:MAG: hypothetical protein PHE84_08705 [bacterium]|nr:hypothetical protein [bacterium]
MKRTTLNLTLITGMVLAGMMALAQIAEAAQAAPPAPLAKAAASVPQGVGIGVTSAFLGNVMSADDVQLSLRINKENIAINPYLGFGTQHVADWKTGLSMGIRVLPTIAKSKQATFSALIGMGMLIEEDVDWAIGFDLIGGFGAEYFFQGLPNVGFSLEGGLDFNLCIPFADNADTGFGVHTVGSTFSGGIHYYFD